MTDPDMQKYADLMMEVKNRISSIDFLLTRKGHALFKATTIESVALQMRKVLELIAFGSLVANKEKYSAAYEKFASHWNARLMLRDLERVNPDFYPQPMIEVPTSDPKAVHQLKERQPDYLTDDEFEKVYEKCGALLHASNPYGSQVDYAYYVKCLPQWRNQILNLLNNHKIKLVGETIFYLVHMKEERDEKVHFYKFGPMPPQ
jgi:hypothetical protein